MWGGYWAQAFSWPPRFPGKNREEVGTGCLATNNSFDRNSLPQVRNPGTWKSKLQTHQECLGRAPATLWKRKDWWRHCGWRNSRIPTWHSYTRKLQKLLRQVSNVNTTVTQGNDPKAHCKCTWTAKPKHYVQGGLASHAIFTISIYQLQCHFYISTAVI